MHGEGYRFESDAVHVTDKKLSDDLIRWIRTVDLPQRVVAHQLKRNHGITVHHSLVWQIRARKKYADVPDAPP